MDKLYELYSDCYTWITGGYSEEPEKSAQDILDLAIMNLNGYPEFDNIRNRAIFIYNGWTADTMEDWLCDAEEFIEDLSGALAEYLAEANPKYIVTERESAVPSYRHSELFDTHEEAYNRMKELYHELAVESNPDAIKKAEIAENSAMVEIYDGNVVEWEIEKV